MLWNWKRNGFGLYRRPKRSRERKTQQNSAKLKPTDMQLRTIISNTIKQTNETCTQTAHSALKHCYSFPTDIRCSFSFIACVETLFFCSLLVSAVADCELRAFGRFFCVLLLAIASAIHPNAVYCARCTRKLAKASLIECMRLHLGTSNLHITRKSFMIELTSVIFVVVVVVVFLLYFRLLMQDAARSFLCALWSFRSSLQERSFSCCVHCTKSNICDLFTILRCHESLRMKCFFVVLLFIRFA